MIVNTYAEPAVEPITVADLESHMGISSGTIATDSTMYSCIAAGSHPVVTGYTLFGSWVEVLGHTAVVYLQPVNNGTDGTVDVKIQESDDQTTITDYSGGAFTQVTEANDTVIQEISYTGTKKYIRTAAKTLVAACEFGTSVMVWEPNASDESNLEELITTARMIVEDDTGRKLVTQTLDYYPKCWPFTDRIKLPYGNLQTVTSVSYKDEDGTETTLVEGTDYIVETNGDQCGFIVLPDGYSWPDETLYVSNPIKIRYVCGYGLAASVPKPFLQAIKRKCTNLYMNKGDDISGQNYTEDKTYKRIIGHCSKLWDMDFL